MYDSLHISLEFINDCFYSMCVCLCTVVPSTQCDVFVFCLSSYYAPYVASFSGMPIFNFPFCILLRLFTKRWLIKLVNYYHCLFICQYQARKVSDHLCVCQGYRFCLCFYDFRQDFRIVPTVWYFPPILSKHEYFPSIFVYKFQTSNLFVMYSTFQIFNNHAEICCWSEISYSFSHTMATIVWQRHLHLYKQTMYIINS